MNKSLLLKIKKLIAMSSLIAGAPLLSGCEENMSEKKMDSTETDISLEDENDYIYATVVLDNESYIIYDHNVVKPNDDGVYRIWLGKGERVDVSTSKIAATFISDEDCNAHDKALEYLSVVNNNNYQVIDYDDDILPKYKEKVKNKTN